ncbi:MAG: universal stress protein [Rhodospirillales bacterium]
MKRFKSILLVCEEETLDEVLVARAVWLAKANGAKITLVDVVEAAPGELARLFGGQSGGREQDVEHEVLESFQRRLSALAKPIRDAGVETDEVVLQGVGFIEIVRQVLRGGHDLIMKRAGGRQEGRSVFFASTDLHLMRKCPCPVWIMNPSPKPRYRRILAAVDPDPQDPQRHALNRMILDLATSLSQADESELQVVHAWRLEEEDTLRHSAFARVPKDRVAALIEEKRQESEGRLQTLLGSYPDLKIGEQVQMLHGQARSVIPELAETLEVELIVMGTLGRTGVRGLIIGNTAESILNQVHCAVLAVKPPGFETPIEA